MNWNHHDLKINKTHSEQHIPDRKIPIMWDICIYVCSRLTWTRAELDSAHDPFSLWLLEVPRSMNYYPRFIDGRNQSKGVLSHNSPACVSIFTGNLFTQWFDKHSMSCKDKWSADREFRFEQIYHQTLLFKMCEQNTPTHVPPSLSHAHIDKEKHWLKRGFITLSMQDCSPRYLQDACMIEMETKIQRTKMKKTSM